MAYTEVKTTGWFERIGGSFRGIVTGFILIALGTCLLWWNEGRTFKTAGAIGEAQMLAQDVQDISRVDPALNGKVIHATGRAETQDVLTDPIFGVSATAIKLSRNVEYYQWREISHSETRKKLGGGEETITTYTYEMAWMDEPVDSVSFHDPKYKGINTTLANINDETFWASHVNFGAYTLPDFLKHDISGTASINIASVDVQSITGVIAVPDDDSWRYYYGNLSADKLVHASGSTVYLGIEPGKPQVGDVRVTFTQTPMNDVSIIAKVIQDTFEPYRASNGYTFSRLSMGKVSMDNMFEGAKSGNNTMAWGLRILGLIIIIIGLRCVLAPLSVIADVIPLLGNIVGAGTGFVALLLGLAWSCIVIAVAWVRFRPIVAGCLIAAAAAIICFLFIRGRKDTSNINIFIFILLAMFAIFAADGAFADPKISFHSYKCVACDKYFTSFPGDRLDAKDFKDERDQLRRVFQFKDRGRNLPPCRNFKYHIFERKGDTTSGISWVTRGDIERLAVIRDGGSLSGINLTEWECLYCHKHFYSLNDENLNIRDWELQRNFLFNLKGQAIPQCSAQGTWGHIFSPLKISSVKSYDIAQLVYDIYWVKD